MTWTAGFGPGLSGGLGSAAFRGWIGVGWSGVPEKTLTTVDNTPATTPVPASFVVVGPDDQPIVGATVRVAGAPIGVTDADGKLAVADLVWAKGVTVQAVNYTDATVQKPAEGADAKVQLGWRPTPVSFVVRDQTGANVSGSLSAVSGPTPVPATPIGSDGTAKLELTPGTWTIAIDSPGRGRQVRGITIVPGGAAQDIEAYLAPDEGEGRLGVTAIDDQGRPLDARVVVDGRPVGTTGVAGLLEVGDLAAGPHRVEIATEGFQTIEVRDVAVKDDAPGAALIALQRMPGSVRVVAHGPDGKPANAVVRFDGPYKADGTPTGDTVRLAPQPLGDIGQRIFILRPGVWQVLVASAELGVQQREVVVPETDTRLIVVDVVLQTAEEGEGRLAVRVVDADGAPIDGALVRLDDKEVGTTSTGGTVSLESLVPGSRKLQVSAAHFRDQEPVDVLVTDGRAERVVTLAYQPGTVFVAAKGPEGTVRDATARFIGPSVAPTVPLGGDGEEYTTLPAGAWTVFVASGHYGLQQRSIVVPEASRSRIPVEVVFSPAEGGVAELTVQVTDPEKNPVANADIKLDGSDLGATSTGGAMTISELDTGPRKLEVAAEPYVTKSQALALKDGGQVVPVALDWAPGATRIAVTGPSGPVTDAIVRLAGPSVMAARPVDGAGKRLFALSPGKWSAVVLSPTLGMAQQEFEILPTKKGLTTVTVSLDALGAGESELMVRVQDPDGRPVSGAQVAIGGAAKGKTSAGGALLIGSLKAGTTAIGATALGFLPLKVEAAQLGEGSQERVLTLQFEPRTVTVVVRDPKGAPLDAEIRFDGPAAIDPKPVGADGTETFQLRPGTWQILAGTEALGTVRKEITLERTTGPQTVEFTLNPKKVDVSAESVVIHEQVMFDFNSTNLRPESTTILDEVAAAILAHPNVAKVQVQGHTDDVGSVEVNFRLSQDRAAAVVQALIARGVPPERLEAQGYGATRPVTPNTDDASRQKNRRVQFEQSYGHESWFNKSSRQWPMRQLVRWQATVCFLLKREMVSLPMVLLIKLHRKLVMLFQKLVMLFQKLVMLFQKLVMLFQKLVMLLQKKKQVIIANLFLLQLK